jgi:hypothetical protein
MPFYPARMTDQKLAWTKPLPGRASQFTAPGPSDMRSVNGMYSKLQFDFYLAEVILVSNNN